MDTNGVHKSTTVSTVFVISVIYLPGRRHGIAGQLIYTPNGRFGAHAGNLPFGVYIRQMHAAGGHLLVFQETYIYTPN